LKNEQLNSNGQQFTQSEQTKEILLKYRNDYRHLGI